MAVSCKNRSIRTMMINQREGVSDGFNKFAELYRKVDSSLNLAIRELKGRKALRPEGTIPYSQAKEILLDMHIDISMKGTSVQSLYDALIKPLDEKMNEARELYNGIRLDTNRATNRVPRRTSFTQHQPGGNA